MTAPIRAVGVTRVAENKRALEVVFNRRPTDDEMRAAHIVLRDLASEFPTLEAMHVDSGGVQFSLKGARRTLRFLAAALAKSFEVDKGVNFVEYEVRSGDRDFVLTLQRRSGLKPTQVIDRVKGELAEAVAALKALRDSGLDNEGAKAMARAVISKAEGGGR